MYLKKAGTFILAASVFIWFASNYPKQPELEEQFAQKIELATSEKIKSQLANELTQKSLENSYLGIIGKSTEPFFAPLGFDWKLTIALETGLAAKEVVVSTLGVLYSLGEDVDEETSGLVDAISKNITLPTAVSFVLFVMIYLPCFAASIVFAKESGSYKYLAYLFVFTTSVAWVISFIGFNLTKLLM
jgi:ferrous iron transport protein B